MITDAVLATIDDAVPPTLGAFIGGRLDVGRGETFEVHDPATGGVIANVGESGPDGIAEAVDKSREAFLGWRRTPPRDRSALILEFGRRVTEHADQLATLDALDSGNPIIAMRTDLPNGRVRHGRCGWGRTPGQR